MDRELLGVRRRLRCSRTVLRSVSDALPFFVRRGIAVFAVIVISRKWVGFSEVWNE
jgi:hypothetical protein